MTQGHDGRPGILVVDDEADDLRSVLELSLGEAANVKVRHPSHVEREDLRDAHLVLMDYRLDHWPEREAQPAAFDVRTGLALAAVLREVADREAPHRLTAVALHTGHLSEVGRAIRPPHSGHVVARLNNLEWVFEKNEASLFRRVVQLAQATQGLQGGWPADSSASETRARELLDLDDQAEWSERAWREVRECQPPLYELGGGSHGVLFLRWLLHRILPYPCFLWDIDWVAARLRIPEEALRQLMTSDSDLARDLRRLKYTGILAGFLGDRWWRTAIEDYAWELAGESSGGAAEFRRRLCAKAGRALELVLPRDPVVCLDGDFKVEGVGSPEIAVRVRPDHWPPFADPAWMDVETVSDDPELSAMVEPLDRYRLAAGS